jgi:hypothetical protein
MVGSIINDFEEYSTKYGINHVTIEGMNLKIMEKRFKERLVMKEFRFT